MKSNQNCNKKSSWQKPKVKQIVTELSNMQHHWNKQVNLCMSEASQRYNRYTPREPKQNTKPEWQIRLEWKMKNLRKQSKVQRMENMQGYIRVKRQK